MFLAMSESLLGGWRLGSGEGDGFSGASVNHTLSGCQAAETATFFGMVYLLLAYREVALERFPEETQQ